MCSSARQDARGSGFLVGTGVRSVIVDAEPPETPSRSEEIPALPTRRSVPRCSPPRPSRWPAYRRPASAAQAATGCKVDDKITNQWQGGFGADVTITNLGDPVSAWTVGWSFGAGQKITTLWNGTATTTGAAVSVASLPWNGSLATNGKTNFGFNASWSGSNPVPPRSP